MIAEDIYIKFVANIDTTEQLNERVEDIEETKRWVYKAGTKPLNEKIKSHVSENFRSIITAIELAGGLPSARKELTTFFIEVIKYAQQIPTVKLTLAFFPTDEFIKKITIWLADQVGKKTVIDISVDEKIIAGLTIEYEGEYRDLSFAGKLNEVIEKGILNISEVKING